MDSAVSVQAPHNRGLLVNNGVMATAHDAPGSLFFLLTLLLWMNKCASDLR